MLPLPRPLPFTGEDFKVISLGCSEPLSWAPLGSRKGKVNSYQEEVKHNHPAPTSIQGFSVGSGLSLPLQHDTLSVLNAKVPVVNQRQLIQFMRNGSKRLNYFSLWYKTTCTVILFVSPPFKKIDDSSCF